MSCIICGEKQGKNHIAKEMMFGFKDEFTYYECASCGCIQLQNPPEDMGRYYPPGYMSLKELAPPIVHPKSRIRRWFFDKRNEALFLGKRGLWSVLTLMGARYDLKPIPSYLQKCMRRGITSRILDVGCGQGELLRDLAGLGFHRLVGVDPFIPKSLRFGNNLEIHACSLEDLRDETFDIIMFHHSLEHMPYQFETMLHVSKLLDPNGVCIIRIPLASSEAWHTYGTDWIELDPPRHFFLHTLKSFEILASRAHLVINSMEFEGDGFAYWGSELYRRGISLFRDPSYFSPINPNDFFSLSELVDFEKVAAAANARKLGGRGIFFLNHLVK
jgi:SAM-dependent methyltransferase